MSPGVDGARPSAPAPSLHGLALLALTLLAYLPALSAGFLWDDDKYLTENPWLGDLAGLARMWVPGNTPQYYPAVFSSFWLEHKLWGLEPFGYHAVNVALHALNALLVWRLARVLALPGAWLLAALFALHPVHVESVAWVTERKNVLSGLFYLGAALAYLRFDDTLERRGRWYALALGLFTLALLAKTVTCSLPAVLILVMLWQRKPVTVRRLAPLVPLFALGLVLALHTAHLERVQVGAQGAEFDFSLAERCLIATRALVFYPWKLCAPWPLVFLYPRWTLEPARLASWLPLLVLVLVAAWAVAGYQKGRRGPALALAFFAGTLFPALGFFDVYPMRYSFVADHFQYLASLGILALFAAGLARFVPRPTPFTLVAAGVLAVLGTLTWRQTHVYASAETLWRATLERNPGAWMARSNLARLLTDRGEPTEALAQLELALESESSPEAEAQLRLNRALTLGKLGRHEEALVEFERLQSTSGGQDVRIAMTLERLGRDEEAEARFRAAPPDDGGAHLAFGLHLLRRGRPEEAVPLLERHAAAHPDDPDALLFLADACAGAGRLDDAIRSAERALVLVRARGDWRTAELVERRLAQFRGGR